MKYKLDRGAHSVYSLHYHLVVVVEDRTGETANPYPLG